MKNARSTNGAGIGADRRQRLMQSLESRRGPLSGTELARRLGVSRQCLVQDVAILRAQGQEILSTPRGYRLPGKGNTANRSVIACQHGPERTKEELTTLVDNGVKVIDVIVEHPLYGELRGTLMIESRSDVTDFIRRRRATNASLLSSLTGGVHLHTVEASRPEMIARAKAQLLARGILLK